MQEHISGYQSARRSDEDDEKGWEAGKCARRAPPQDRSAAALVCWGLARLRVDRRVADTRQCPIGRWIPSCVIDGTSTSSRDG